jgi:negative regulator of flagellin synthesis FlgM
MKIGPLESKPSATPVATERKAQSTSGTTAAGGSAEPSAKVALSSAAMLSTDGADGSFDTEKVKRIAQAIRDGQFEINPEAIADKLIANAQELLGKTSR